jgi:hypothetical protein
MQLVHEQGTVNWSIAGRLLIFVVVGVWQASKYILKATATDDDGNAVEAALPLGRTLDEWKVNNVTINYSSFSNSHTIRLEIAIVAIR